MKYPATLLLLFLFVPGVAQFQKFADDLFFNRYGTDDGLSQASVNAILKDSKGFMWFGTDDGLNRFDGHQFRVYKRAEDSTSLIGNTVQALWEDSMARIWIGTSEGLTIYDRHRETFTSFYIDDLEFYSCLDLRHDEQNQKVWIAGGINGLLSFDLNTNSLVPFVHPLLKDLNILRLERIGDTLYLGTLDKGLYALNTRTRQVAHTVLGKVGSGLRVAIRAMLSDGDNLWLGTEGEGIKRLNRKTGDIKAFTQESGHLNDNQVWSLVKDGDVLWIGTDGGGLNVMDTRTEKVSVHRHSYYNSRSISSNTIRCIAKDRIGDLWFGSFNGGVSYLPAFTIKFHSFRNEPSDPSSLPYNAVLSFCELSDGRLLIGTDGGGLAFLKDGNFYPWKFPKDVQPPTVILSIIESEEGDILLGTYQEGLYRITTKGKVIRYLHEPSDKNTISSNIIWDIAEDEYGSFWLATEVGLNRLRREEHIFTNYRNRTSEDAPELFNSDFTQSLIIDSANTLWVGFFGSLLECYLPTGTTKIYLSGSGPREVPNKQVLSLHLDNSNRNVLWFSSFGEGLVRFHLIDKTFQLISRSEGLPTDQIFAVQTDKKGIVWASTDKGIMRHDPRQKTFYLFEKGYGVNTGPFKDNAGGRTGSGYLLFGGTNGFTAFWPARVSFQKTSLDVVFTGFRLFNEEVPIDTTILEKSITETTSLAIPFERAKFINLQFAVPNFLAPNTVQYQYMLESFEDSWHTVENKDISFTNLLPGKYNLRVKAGFPSGIWGNERVLSITVVPPWWMTWYARGALIMLLGAMGYGFYLYRTYSLNRRKVELEMIVANQYLEIREKNDELAQRNEELTAHNEELLANRETISVQNQMLFDAQRQLQDVNQSLENLVQQRTEKLNDTILQLNKTIKELDAFLYSASHDLVSPLKSILGLVNLAKLENKNPELEYYFRHIEISVTKLESIIQMLMQHSFNSKTELRLEAVDLEKIVGETVSEMKFLPEAANITFRLGVDNAEIVSDARRLKIILSNLLGNAVKYHDGQKPENLVHVEFKKTDTTWSLDILDNGIGIEKDRLNRVFELFYRATEASKGSGLGLYIVKDTIDRLGGSIAVQSQAGQWTKFTLSFPLNNRSMLN